MVVVSKRKNILRFLQCLSLISFAVWQGLFYAQAAHPTLAVRLENTNVIFSLPAQPGLFYTWQTSSNFSNWLAREAIYANAPGLSLTESTAGLSGAEFVRAKANSPNTATVTNYASWTNSVLLNNGLVEAVIV